MSLEGKVEEPNYGRVPGANKNMLKTQPFSASNDLGRSALAGIVYQTPLSKAFFSPQNVKWVQDELRHRVFKQSGDKYIIDYQDEKDFSILMRDVFLQNAVYQVGREREEILSLNEKVLNKIVKSTIIAVDSYRVYMDELANPVRVMDYGSYENTAGTRGKYTGSAVQFI